MKERSGTPEAEHNVSAELKDLLEEVKTVFTANMAALKTASSGHQRHQRAEMDTSLDR